MNEGGVRRFHDRHDAGCRLARLWTSARTRRVRRYRGRQPLPSLKGRTVILVDDGIATGATFYASLGALVKDEVGRLVAAVPVAPSHAMTELRMLVDERVVLHTSEWFFGISRFYERFPLVEDDEVVACLEAACVALSGREQTPA